MIVRRTNFQIELVKLAKETTLAFDCETTGLYPYLGDRLFSLVLHNGTEGFYFNFQPYPGLSEDWILPRTWIPELKIIFGNAHCLFIAHNAKFDLAMLSKEGVEIAGTVHDTEVGARMEFNRHFNYTLDACAGRIGEEKSSAVADYIKKHKLHDEIIDPGTGEKTKKPRFDKVPFDIMAPYALKDAEIAYKLGMHQLEWVKKDISHTVRENLLLPQKLQTVDNFFNTELALTKVCFAMERTGIKIDRGFCLRALEHEKGLYTKALTRFKDVSGFDLVDSPKSLQKAFDAVGEEYPRTEKGNPSFTADVLDGMTSPLAQILLDYRKAYKKAHTYYQNFLDLSDGEDRIHANMRQAGTDTTRFSYSEPNLQNLPKNSEDAPKEDFLIRRAFVPTNEEYCLVPIDYDQMEYRFMLEYAQEMSVIEKVLGGLDVHQATANQMNVTRTQAKTLNFLLLYGGGVKKLADNLGVDEFKARELRAQYFAMLPRISAFTRRVMKRAEDSELIRSWAGFPFRFPYYMVNGQRQHYAYAAPNHLIQGGCAQVVRKAMVGCFERLRGMKSRMLVQVHDELVFEIHKSELAVIADLKDIMESAYPHKFLPLTCSVSYSWKSWADKVSGFPDGNSPH